MEPASTATGPERPPQKAPHQTCGRAACRNVVDTGKMITLGTGKIGNQGHDRDVISAEPIDGGHDIGGIDRHHGNARR